MTGLRSGQVARAAGVNLQTLRYYERRGLLDAPDRTPGGHRVYPAKAVTVLRVIKAAQRLGFSLEEVIELLETGRHRHHSGPDAGLAQRAAAKLAEVEAKIADLPVIAATLRAVLDAGCADLIECAGLPYCPLRSPGSPARPGRWPAMRHRADRQPWWAASAEPSDGSAARQQAAGGAR